MRVALTGAASGIGAQVAARLKADGHEVVAFDISDPGTSVDRWIETDMAEPGSIANALKQADGRFDALLGNAGLPPRAGLEQTILRVNYTGLKFFQDGMLDKLNAGASIVNTASRAGAMWRDNLDQVKALMALEFGELAGFIRSQQIDPTRAYHLSKEAVIVMTMAETGALLQRDLRINSVSPAAVSTAILPDFAAAFGDRMEKNVARVGRPGRADEIAEVIVFLASAASHWIKGQDLVIDGGMSAIAVNEMMALGGAAPAAR